MVFAIPEDGKLGQADLINSSRRLTVWVDPNSTPSKEEVFPDPSGKSVHLRTDEPDLHGIETKGIQ